VKAKFFGSWRRACVGLREAGKDPGIWAGSWRKGQFPTGHMNGHMRVSMWREHEKGYVKQAEAAANLWDPVQHQNAQPLVWQSVTISTGRGPYDCTSHRSKKLILN
jgi:hypothetical protein